MWTDLSREKHPEAWKGLPEEVQKELCDPRFSTRTHYTRKTYADGCRGPLCRLIESHRWRRRAGQRAREQGTTYTPALQLEEIDREIALMKVVEWHQEEIAHYKKLVKSQWEQLELTLSA